MFIFCAYLDDTMYIVHTNTYYVRTYAHSVRWKMNTERYKSSTWAMSIYIINLQLT
jgi:hypothetical protein